MGEDLRAELEAAIDDNADDDRVYEVFGDYLQELGDPRGELIAIAVAASRDRAMESVAMARRIELDHVFTPTIGGVSPQVTWRNGFIQKVQLWSADALPLLAHPSLRFVREIALPRLANMKGLVQAIAAAPSRRAIRELDVGGAPTVSDQKVPVDLEPLWSALPNLKRIRLRGIEATFGVGDVPLPRLAIEASSYYGARSLDALSWARWPSLEWFELAYDDDVAKKRAAGVALVRFLSGSLPALRHLGVRGGILDEREPAAFAMFELAALFAHLDSLDLSDNLLHDETMRMLASRPAVLANLRSLDVSRNRLTETGIAAVAGRVREFRADGPHRALEREEVW